MDVMMICDFCGTPYIYSCPHCTKRIEVWGENGLIYILGVAKRTNDIKADELLSIVNKYYIGKAKKNSDKVNVLKTTLRLLGYKGNFVGRIHKNGIITYVQIRKLEHEAGRRYKLKNNSCDKCGEKEDLYLHHIVPRYWGGLSTPENCITLCKSCHEKVNKKLSQKLNRALLLKYLEPHHEEIENIAKQSM